MTQIGKLVTRLDFNDLSHNLSWLLNVQDFRFLCHPEDSSIFSDRVIEGNALLQVGWCSPCELNFVDSFAKFLVSYGVLFEHERKEGEREAVIK